MYLVLLFAAVVVGDEIREPMYQYRYETEDMMKTASSHVPLRGYHVVEGGYYPENFGFSGFGPAKYTSTYPQFVKPGGFGGQGYYGFQPHYFPHYQGGEYVDRNQYGSGKKLLNDGAFEKAHGTKYEEGKDGKEGFSEGKVGFTNNKGDSGYYSDQEGGKKVIEDGKSYNGGQHFNQEGKSSDEQQRKNGHKKGHKVKGFKTYHHKDESGKTEEFFDEGNDEGDNFNFSGKSGNFGEMAKSDFKGGHENGQFNANQGKKQSNYDSAQFANNNNADQGEYGQKKYYGNGLSYGSNNGIDQESLLGHQESSRMYKHHPYHHVPVYSEY